MVIELQATFQAWKHGWQWKGSHLLSLVILVLSSGYFPHQECFSPSFGMAGLFSIFSIVSNECLSGLLSLVFALSQAQTLIQKVPRHFPQPK